MQISVLCNAGLALRFQGETLLIDALNDTSEPFCQLNEDTWRSILEHTPPFENISALYFTHNHADHYCEEKVVSYLNRWPGTPVFIPQNEIRGKMNIGSFLVEYQRFEHAPMDVPTPPHVVTLISAGQQCVYIAADAKLDIDGHKAFLDGRQADVAFWNSMYLSQPETRTLMKETAKQNYIYHMPEVNPDGYGLWKKLDRNLERYKEELETVTVITGYPYEIE